MPDVRQEIIHDHPFTPPEGQWWRLCVHRYPDTRERSGVRCGGLAESAHAATTVSRPKTYDKASGLPSVSENEPRAGLPPEFNGLSKDGVDA
jgi:hypothetical protein